MWFCKKNSQGPVGLLAGKGDFPLLFAQEAALGGRGLIVVGVEGVTSPELGKYASEIHFLRMTDFDKFVLLLKSKNIRQLVMAGAFPKTEIQNPQFKSHSKVRAIIGKLGNKGDDHLMRAFELYLRIQCGTRVADARLFMPDLAAPRGVMTRTPTTAEWKDLRFGWKIAKGIGKMDIGQAVIVRDGTVLAVEALEGTDNAIRRAGKLGRDGAVVVKVAKPGQDLRIDLPCVGPQTIDTMRECSCRLIGIEAGKTLMLRRREMIEIARGAGIGIVGL